MDTSLLAWYLAPAAALVLVYVVRRKRAEAAHARELAGSIAAGLTEPPSLHPTVDPLRCIGSGGCVRACPEKALGLVGGRATLVSPAACIGHGACEAACPVQAITLVFGSERRGEREQVAFLVECRSLSGFSGSPAFVHLAQPRLTEQRGWIPSGLRFLGVDCAHIPFWSQARESPRIDAPRVS